MGKRRLSKRKLSLWFLLIVSLIIYFNFPAEKARKICSKKAKQEKIKEDIDHRLAEKLDSFMHLPRVDGSYALCVYDATAGKYVYQHNIDSMLRPASNMKMLTCVTAMRRLGPNYMHKSAVYMSGEVRKDTLYGDICFKFLYDPFFTADSLRQLVRAVANKHVRYVKGQVIVDAAIAQPMQHEEHWTMGDLPTRRLGLLFKGATRVKKEVSYLLHTENVRFSDSALVEGKKPSGMKMLKETKSNVRQSIYLALQNSSNINAECLLYPLGEPYVKDGDYRSAGVKALRRFVSDELRLNPGSVCDVHDGSGLCIYDRMSPRLLIHILKYVYGHEYIRREFLHGLPISGKTGTLHKRMRRPAVMGKVHAKTGTLTRENGITSLSGYARGSNGHLLMFAIIENGVPVADARIWQDRFCEVMVK